jgi:pyruvate formate lyase activating enzyme
MPVVQGVGSILTAEKSYGLIFDVQGFSVHDGPGCRTLIFFSGCPLRCTWCANPEGQQRMSLLLYRSSLCGCSDFSCIKGCPAGAIRKNPAQSPSLLIDRSRCRHCPSTPCVEHCFHEALRKSARLFGLDEIMALISRDRNYWGSGGGLTLGGGDPLMQPYFAQALLRECRKHFIHTALETSAHFPYEQFYETASLADWLFVDVKHGDSRMHMEWTGAGNELILDNISRLKSSAWKGRLIVRVPVVPGFNDREEVIRQISRTLCSCGVDEMNLLPFHRLGASKYEQLGMTYACAHLHAPPDEKMRSLKETACREGLSCYCGHETPF